MCQTVVVYINHFVVVGIPGNTKLYFPHFAFLIVADTVHIIICSCTFRFCLFQYGISAQTGNRRYVLEARCDFLIGKMRKRFHFYHKGFHLYRRKKLTFLAWNLKDFSKNCAEELGARKNRRYAVFLTRYHLFWVFIRKDRAFSRLQWLMAWEASFHPEVPHSPPLPNQWGSPEKARHCRWGYRIADRRKPLCHP